MRTTLTVDDRVLAARGRVRRRRISVGEALSELAMIGCEAESAGLTPLPVLPAVAGHVITVERVDGALDSLDGDGAATRRTRRQRAGRADQPGPCPP